MYDYEDIEVRLRITLCIVMFFSIFFVIFVVSDYMRAQECIEQTYATVTRKTSHSIGEFTYAYDYDFSATIRGKSIKFSIPNVRQNFSVSNAYLVQMNREKHIYRVPNAFY